MNPANTDAGGPAELSSWQDAWDTLDAMPPAAQASPEALRLRVALSVPLDKWDVGTEAAFLLCDGGREDRETASLFFQAFAVECLRDGDEEGAELFVVHAFDAWPEGKIEIIHPMLGEYFSRVRGAAAEECGEVRD
ncbi:MAG: hypothetical protein B9S38_00690 [Verrucomicrobiia bacterium Tous-C4TDCM]|nr:MAG: hypothetical protein B9S38_00690 [Verrucomicrobiae bacterium Tous-C4TDCM]